jgi:excisionase family DNA binding protein
MSQAIQPRYLNLKDASKYCGLSARTLERAVKDKKVKSYIQGRRLIDRESLDAWITGANDSGDGGDLARLEKQMADLSAELSKVRELLEQGRASGLGWFSLQSAAEYTDFTERSITNATKLGQLKFRRVRIKGERFCVRIKREWLDEWLEKQPVI